jgi:hypothetical protein
MNKAPGSGFLLAGGLVVFLKVPPHPWIADRAVKYGTLLTSICGKR